MILLSLLLAFSIVSTTDKPYVSLGGRGNAGLFSNWQDVLGLVKWYDEGVFSGVEVDFKSKGYYYDPRHGENWWEYYCEPIRLGEKKDVVRVDIDDHTKMPFPINRDFSSINAKWEAERLISKYIRLKPHLRGLIDDFAAHNFAGYTVIGVHFRGTDKKAEAARITYGHAMEAMKKVQTLLKGKKVKFFIATDEQPFIHFALRNFDRVCYTPWATRAHDSSKPVHTNASDPYKVGEDAVIDAYLLSKCHYLIRTRSNLSEWSTLLNPNLPVVMLN